MNHREKEAIRYLGYGRNAVDDNSLDLVSDVFRELEPMIEKRIVCRIFDCSLEEDYVLVEGMKIKSRALLKNLKGCQQVVLIGATIGAEVDRLLRKYGILDTARMVVLQACAATLLEECLDEWQEAFREKKNAEGWYLRPRFSPGYGDFDISHQKEILRLLESEKRIGLMATESGMLTPTKSVTAFLGLSRSFVDCHKKGCESCGKRDCLYRRKD